MRACSVLFAVALLTGAADDAIAGGKSGGNVAVRGYVRKDGTYVAPHMRSAPDASFQNNWSTSGNVNPYTGEEGKLVTPRHGVGGLGVPSAGATYPAVSTPQPSLLDAAPATTSTSPDSAAPSFKSGPELLPAVLPGLPSLEHNQLTPALPRSAYSPPVLRESTKPRNGSPDGLMSYAQREQLRNVERAAFWKERGYSFNPESMSAFSMDQKVKDIERARYWRERGHSFNPAFMSAFAMDQKVKDIERAKYWGARGYSFNPDYMSAFAMDQKVKDIERSKYWEARGIRFNPEYMSAFGMDQEARRRGLRPE